MKSSHPRKLFTTNRSRDDNSLLKVPIRQSTTSSCTLTMHREQFRATLIHYRQFPIPAVSALSTVPRTVNSLPTVPNSRRQFTVNSYPPSVAVPCTVNSLPTVPKSPPSVTIPCTVNSLPTVPYYPPSVTIPCTVNSLPTVPYSPPSVHNQ